MKMIRSLTAILAVSAFLAAAIAVFADVPPDPGYKRVSLSIIVEPIDDLSDYRFFLKSGFELREYTLKKGEKVTMSSMGGGALYRNGKLLAVPKASLKGLDETPSGDRLNPMQKAIADGAVPGTITLIEHAFTRDVRTAEAKGLKDPQYRLEKDGDKGVKAVLVSGGMAENTTGGNTDSYYSTGPKSPAFWATIAGGSLITLAMIFFGVYVLRRSKAGAGNVGSLAK